MKCKAKILLKLTEKEVVGEVKDHDHAPPIRVFDKGACQIKGKIGNGGSTTKTVQPEKVAQTEFLTRKIDRQTGTMKTVQIQTMGIQSTSVLTVGVQTTEIATVEMEIQTPQTTDSQMQTYDIPTMDVQIPGVPNLGIQPQRMNLDMECNVFAEVPPSYQFSSTASEPLNDSSMPRALVSSNSSRNTQPTIFFESPGGVQISTLPHTVDSLNSSESCKLGEISQPVVDVNGKANLQQNNPGISKEKQRRCPKHEHLPANIKVSKNESCNYSMTPVKVKNVLSDLRKVYPKSASQSIIVTRPNVQFKAETPKQSTQTFIVTHPKTASQTIAQPINISRTSYSNLVFVQTDTGPKILALPPLSRSPITTQLSSSAHISQSLHSMVAQRNVVDDSPLVIDITSSLVVPSPENQTKSSNIQPYSTIVDKPSTLVNVANPSMTLSTASMKSQPSSLMVDQPSVYSRVVEESTSEVKQDSPKLVRPSPALLTQLSASMVSQFFTSLEQPSAPKIKIDHPSASQVEPSSLDVDQPSTSKIKQPFTSQIDQLSTLQINQLSSSQIDQLSSLEVGQSLTLEIDQPSTAKVHQPSILDIVQPSTSAVERLISEVESTSITETMEVEQPRTSEDKQPFIEIDDSSSEDYLPPKAKATNITNTKKVIIAKRISKPRKSKYRAELLLKTYLSDYSDDD